MKRSSWMLGISIVLACCGGGNGRTAKTHTPAVSGPSCPRDAVVIVLARDAQGASFVVRRGEVVLVDASYAGPVPSSELDELAGFLESEHIARVILDASDGPPEGVDRMTAALTRAGIETHLGQCAGARPRPRPVDHLAIACSDGRRCFERGAAYFGSDGRPLAGVTEADLWRAGRYFEAACDAGLRRGCHSAGNLYRSGLGVSRSLVAAQKLYTRACIDHDTTPESCAQLAATERELGSAR